MKTVIRSYNYLEDFIDNLRSEGRYSFTLMEVKNQFQISPEAVKKSIQRLGRKNKIVHIRKGFYIIVPPEYSSKGIVPPSFFIPDLMKFLGRDYYLGLLNAASYFGAAHQQPQEYYIITTSPTLRKINNHSVKINFCKKKEWDTRFVMDQKTEAGYVRISSPELTAIDLIFFQDRIGGFDRVSTILEELSTQINPNTLLDCAKTYNIISVVQRLGFILEIVLGKAEIVKPLKKYLQRTKYFPLFLNPSSPIKPELQIENDWKIIQNIIVEPDI
jgi:predicted transcriptional regulator of viral defense system